MLAFAKDITKTNPSHPEESKNSELKQYMDYQRALNHERLIYHALDQAKNDLQNHINEFENNQEKLKTHFHKSFPLSNGSLKSTDTTIFMLRKLINGHNSSNNWYRINAYYHALIYDCIKSFIDFYNNLLRSAPEKAKELNVSKGIEVDFDDWINLFFPDLDFHIGKNLTGSQYPFAKRNKTIEEKINTATKNGKSFEDALKEIQEQYEIDESSASFLNNKEINKENMELFYTSVENPIYEYLTEKEEGRWGALEGESILDQAYYLGSTLKVWEWRKKEDAESFMEDMKNSIKK